MTQSIRNRNHFKSLMSRLTALMIVVVFSSGVFILLDRPTYATDCDKKQKELKRFKSQKKAREKSLTTYKLMLKETKFEVYEKKYFFHHYNSNELVSYSLPTAAAICEIEELRGKFEYANCAKIQSAFKDAYERVKKWEDQVELTKKEIYDLEDKIQRTKRYIEKYCPENLSPDPEPEYTISGSWSISQANGYSGTLNITDLGNGKFKGNADWTHQSSGRKLSGQIIKGKIKGSQVSFRIQYGSMHGDYTGVFGQGGNVIKSSSGSTVSSTNESSTWTAKRKMKN